MTVRSYGGYLPLTGGKVTGTLTMAGNILADSAGTRDLGSPAQRWSTLYADSIALAGLSPAGSGTLNLFSFIQGTEQSAPSAPAADGYRIFAQDNGAGKTQLMVLFSSGAAQQLAIQP